jgi:hypothetical protein
LQRGLGRHDRQGQVLSGPRLEQERPVRHRDSRGLRPPVAKGRTNRNDQ